MKLGFPILVFTLLMTAMVSSEVAHAEEGAGLAVGAKAPPFKLPVVNVFKETAKKWGPAKFEGKKIVLMSFFATWCEPCKKEMPELVRLHEKYKDEGLGVMLVSIDSKDDADAVVALTAEQNVTFPVVHDRFKVVGRRYAATKLPYLLMLTPDREIKKVHVGYDDEIKLTLEDEIRVELGMKKLKKKKKKKRRSKKRRSKKRRKK